jgi:hypothetical protein
MLPFLVLARAMQSAPEAMHAEVIERVRTQNHAGSVPFRASKAHIWTQVRADDRPPSFYAFKTNALLGDAGGEGGKLILRAKPTQIQSVARSIYSGL